MEPRSHTYIHAGRAAGAMAGARRAQPRHARDLKQFRARAAVESTGPDTNASRGGYKSARSSKIFAFGAHSPKSAFPDMQLFPHIHAVLGPTDPLVVARVRVVRVVYMRILLMM